MAVIGGIKAAVGKGGLGKDLANQNQGGPGVSFTLSRISASVPFKKA
jgi:hypothetical protein